MARNFNAFGQWEEILSNNISELLTFEPQSKKNNGIQLLIIYV